MPSCPSGHNSTASDFCDVCGLRLQTYTSPKTPELRPTVAPWSHGPEQWFSEEQTGGSCPECGTARAGRFCEECGYDFVLRYEEHQPGPGTGARKSTRLNSSHVSRSYAVFCLKKK